MLLQSSNIVLVQKTRAAISTQPRILIDDDADNQVALRPSQSENTQMTIMVLESLLLTKHENATDCRVALEDAIDQ